MAVSKRKRVGRVMYQAEVFVAGARVASECFDTRATAHAWHDKTKKRFESGVSESSLTLADVIAQYRIRVFPSFTEHTRHSIGVRLDCLGETPTAAAPVRDLTAAGIDKMLDWLSTSERSRTPWRITFRKELRVLSSVLMFYREHFDERFVSPILKRHQKKADYKGKPKNRRGQDFYLTPEQAKRWFGELATLQDPVYAAIARFQVIMGVRVGEAAALCWDVVDLDTGTVEIKRTMEWILADGSSCRQIRDRVKTESSRRTLPLPVQVVALLRELKSKGPAVVSRGESGNLLHVVFASRQGRPVCYATVRATYNRCFKRTGIPWTATHVCRHTNGTLGIRGARAEAVQVSLGHSSVQQTEGYARAKAMVENVVPGNVARLLE